MERKLYLLSPLQAEFYENESDRMYPDDVMDGRALAVYGADILQKMQERADHVGEDLMEYYDEKDSVKEKSYKSGVVACLKGWRTYGMCGSYHPSALRSMGNESTGNLSDWAIFRWLGRRI